MIRTFPEVLNFNSLFLKVDQFVYKQSVLPTHGIIWVLPTHAKTSVVSIHSSRGVDMQKKC